MEANRRLRLRNIAFKICNRRLTITSRRRGNSEAITAGFLRKNADHRKWEFAGIVQFQFFAWRFLNHVRNLSGSRCAASPESVRILNELQNQLSVVEKEWAKILHDALPALNKKLKKNKLKL